MNVDYDEFKKLDIRISLVKECEKVPKSRNLYNLKVDCGENELRQIITGISNYYEPHELIGRKIVVLTNLKPRMIMGLESRGMLLAADLEGEPFLLKVDEREGKEVPPGALIK